MRRESTFIKRCEYFVLQCKAAIIKRCESFVMRRESASRQFA
jgi:hypothetical protein